MKDFSERLRHASHRECWDLLPWLVNETLNEAQQRRLESHLAGCADCRREAAEQKFLKEHLRQEDSVLYAPQASLQKLLDRIDEAGPLPEVASKPSRRQFGRQFAGSTAAKLLAATVVVGVVSFVAVESISSWRLVQQRSEPRYSTLTSKPAVSVSVPAARVVFAPTMSLSQLSELLRTSNAQVVTGPTEAGVYTLVFGSAAGNGPAIDRQAQEAQVSAAVQVLRRNPNVLFAEVVAAEPRGVQQP
jgi:hypothetical protein